MTLDLAKIKSDAEIIASRCDMLLMTLPVRDVLAMVAEIECAAEEIQKSKNSMSGLRECFRQANETISNFYLTIKKLKDENEALRKLKLPHYLKLSDEMRADGDHAEQRAREDQCYSVPVLKAVFFEAAIQRWLHDQEEAIDAAMTKEN